MAEIDIEKVKALIEKKLPMLDDESLQEYLAGAISELDSFGDDGQELVESIAPFLESYGCAESHEEAEQIMKDFYKDMLADGIINDKNAAAATATEVNMKLNAPIAALELDEGEDDWGINDVKVKNKANVVVETIMSKQEMRRRQRKEERERKKEDVRARNEEEQFKREREESENVVLASDAIMTGPGTRSRDVNVAGFTMSIGGKTLLHDADIKIVAGKKYGLIGRNGVGKTTLLKHIARRQVEGFPINLSVLHVEQEVVGDDTKVIECVLKADAKRTTMLEEEARLSKLVETDVQVDTDGKPVHEKLKHLYEEMAAMGVDSAESDARRILSGLSFPPEMQEMATKDLSGGWRMRVAIASALFLQPDILMLDEPTNHLDLEAAVWLERYLQNYDKTVMLVSHDRKFSNNVITDVIHFLDNKLHYYNGDIDTFETTRHRQRLAQQREFESQQLKRDHIQKFIDKFRFNAARASLVQSRIKAMNRMQLVDEVLDDPTFQFSFPSPISELGRPILQVQDVSFGYPVPVEDPEPGEDGVVPPKPAPKLLFENVNFGVDNESRIAILGPNGCGKTTLLNCILGELEPVTGYIQRNAKLRIANFSQHHVDGINMNMSPLEYLLDKFKGTKPDELRPHLARYGIPADLAEQRIRTLSGGQKSRVAFATVTWLQPHILVLDEPTNHLDLETVEALITAVATFEGGVIFVSHDQHFISKCAEEYWVVQNRQVTRFKGNFDEYKAWAMPVEK